MTTTRTSSCSPKARIVTDNQVRAVFAELNVPIITGLEMQIAGRHEDFVDLDLKATSPKVAVRYQPLAESRRSERRSARGSSRRRPTRCSSKTAPTAPRSSPGVDPFYPGVSQANLNGSTSCRNGNPDLKPEESTVYNVGFTWEIIDDLEFSLDYQTIEYVDRIIEMGSADILNRDFAKFLEANGLTSRVLQPHDTQRCERRGSRPAWIASVTRGPLQNDVHKVASVLRTYENLSTNEVDVFDAKLKYSFDVGSFGYFTHAVLRNVLLAVRVLGARQGEDGWRRSAERQHESRRRRCRSGSTSSVPRGRSAITTRR